MQFYNKQSGLYGLLEFGISPPSVTDRDSFSSFPFTAAVLTARIADLPSSSTLELAAPAFVSQTLSASSDKMLNSKDSHNTSNTDNHVGRCFEHGGGHPEPTMKQLRLQ